MHDYPLLNSLAGIFDEQIKDAQHVRLMEQVSRGFWAKTASRLSVDRVWTALEPFYEKLVVLILNELEGQIFPSLAPERWASSACWFEFFITVLDCKHLSEEWKVFRELTTECAWFFPFEGVCVVCDRPTKLTFDERFHLHVNEGFAIEFSDGFCAYARHRKLIAESDKGTED